MLAEAASTLFLVFRRPAERPLWAALVGPAPVGLIWASIALLQVPRHTALGSGIDRAALSGLALTNWLRTAAWSVRGMLVLWIAARALGQARRKARALASGYQKWYI